ncbi:hypothetical protein [Luteimicrobium subarcticum]|uniref:Heavy metal transporter n=1 Tax=Luteimicrobium subarcticum TaxID=620910 RepID=A0A2M8WUL5_9MICO|nr:hypothetical protein CLV34_0457 [Luteimicrobium subarcticum]
MTGTFVGLVAAGAGAVVLVARHFQHPAPLVLGCTATADDVGWPLTPDQADNAATITAVTVRRGLPARAATVALATAQQESKLRNIEYGDRDSLGLFQQRPSQGWGTDAQILDPVHATGEFLDHLVQVPDWQKLEITVAAQRVQRSAYPQAYAIHEASARAWASGLTGWTPAGVTCTLAAIDGAAPADGSEPLTADDVADRLDQDYGTLPHTVDTAARTVTVDARPLGSSSAADARAAWSVASWAVATASAQDVVRVDVDGQSWVRGQEGWHTADDDGSAAADPGAGRVRITVAH